MGKRVTADELAARQRDPAHVAKWAARLRGKPPLPDVPAEYVAMCHDCHEAKGCPNATVCCGGTITVAITQDCPHGHFSL
jgi:hypothetical protein